MTEENPIGPAELRVLVVEDETRLRDLLLRALPDMGYAAQSARSGEEAMRKLDWPPDIVILDLNLPGVNGMEVFKRLREKSAAAQVIIVTGFGDLESAREAIRMDVSDFLTKPCHLGELEKALDRARRRIEALRPAPAPPFTWTADEEDADAPPKLQDIERQHIVAALERHKGNRSAAAQELGISLRTLYYRLNEYQKQGFRID